AGLGGLLVQPADGALLAPPARRAPLELLAPYAGAPAARALAARTDPATRRRESALGIQADRRRTQGAWYLGFGHFRAQGAARERSSACAATNAVVVANLLASAGGEHAGLRLPDHRDRVGCTYSIFLQIERIWYA